MAPASGLRIAPETQVSHWSRALYPHWSDLDHDGRDTREEVLEHWSLVPVTRKGGRIVRGLWVGPYTGRVVTHPGQLDVDHVVPLEEVQRSGGSEWTPARRERYANTPGVLLPVLAGANRSKRDRDPASWMPPNRAYWCDYLALWETIKRGWDLSIDPREKRALERGERICTRYRVGDSLDGR